jgi:hypothetical protein
MGAAVMSRPRALFVPFALGLCATQASAYESDPLSARRDPPADATIVANAHATEMLSGAIDRVNAATQCKGDDHEMHLAVAKEISRTMTENRTVPSRGRQPQMWFGAYAAWLEDGPIERMDFRDRTDVYSEVRTGNSAILHVFGPASTIQLAGVLLGTDKIDHFWVQGYDYFRVSKDGVEPERAVRWGTRSELGIWGEATTGVFSYADLAANYDGYQFYATLLSPTSSVQRDDEGCVRMVRPFDWSDWVDWHYDEALNPSVFTEGIAQDVERWTTSKGNGICSDDAVWQTAWTSVENTAHTRDGYYVSAKAPSRDVQTDLTDLCPSLALAVANEPATDDALVVSPRAGKKRL